jgi:hypothetical protein
MAIASKSCGRWRWIQTRHGGDAREGLAYNAFL